jgi:hypothetical protein
MPSPVSPYGRSRARMVQRGFHGLPAGGPVVGRVDVVPYGESRPNEAAEALETASEIIDAAAQLLPNLEFF